MRNEEEEDFEKEHVFKHSTLPNSALEELSFFQQAFVDIGTRKSEAQGGCILTTISYEAPEPLELESAKKLDEVEGGPGCGSGNF
ncbi:hypothetical protein RDI58_010536 [Solanum bulbocastanum]|uniref:Uncharacterized protein n=1 Tax=Solanum bulbocastanum TaxID=147425 RepID=A0AAN8YG35_SOLBU